MGTWDIGTFENDDACDWADELVDTSDLAMVEAALDPEEIDGYYLEAPDCVRILCAGEILAALEGRASATLPENVRNWVNQNRALDPGPLREKAVQKIDRVLADHSELYELWSENEKLFATWRTGVSELRTRLQLGRGA
jgi:uncharacterized protein DUF4259